MKRKIKNPRAEQRLRRVAAVRKKVTGSAERPRLSIFKSAKHMYAQIIDDDAGRTLVAVSTTDKEIGGGLAGLKKVARAEKLGAKIAEAAKAKGISSVVFDRNGWRYHGRVAALAKGAREGGLQF
jgi:large subunit ribosomal protein L18